MLIWRFSDAMNMGPRCTGQGCWFELCTVDHGVVALCGSLSGQLQMNLETRPLRMIGVWTS